MIQCCLIIKIFHYSSIIHSPNHNITIMWHYTLFLYFNRGNTTVNSTWLIFHIRDMSIANYYGVKVTFNICKNHRQSLYMDEEFMISKLCKFWVTRVYQMKLTWLSAALWPQTFYMYITWINKIRQIEFKRGTQN